MKTKNESTNSETANAAKTTKHDCVKDAANAANKSNNSVSRIRENEKDIINPSHSSEINAVPSKYKAILRSCSIKLIRYENIEDVFKATTNSDNTVNSNKQQVNTKMDAENKIANEAEPERRYPKRNRVQRFDATSVSRLVDDGKKGKAKIRHKNEDSLKKMDFWYSWYKVSISF